MHISIIALVLILCLLVTGCASIGAACYGLGSLITTLVLLPFKVLSYVIAIVNKMPKPPPGVF